MIEVIKENWEQTNTTVQQLYRQKKKAWRALDKAKREMEEELYRKLYEDCRKKLVYKMAQERDEDSQDVKTGSVIKDKSGKLVTDRKDVLQVWEYYFKELLNQKENSELELPSVVEGEVKLEEIRDAQVERAMKKTKRERFVERLVMAECVGIRNLIPISIFYILPVVQLMFNYTELLKLTGNQDLCYFNFQCVNPVGVLYSFNNVFSNIGYVMLGLLFLIIVHRRDTIRNKLTQQGIQLNQRCGIPQQFGLFYAMGIALVMEGILSSCYHVCPNHSNFQFDTAFMYVMACLLVSCCRYCLHKRHPDINPHAHTAYTAMSLVIFIQVVGVVYMPMVLLIVFTVVHLVCTLLLSIQIYYMGRWKLDLGIFVRVYQLLKVDRHRCAIPMYMDRICLLLIGIIVNMSV
ncbi:SID1 transmembrane family member 2 [Lamellibrachia satsuma]|nr:SID1 transmembrane family member 2 [Lamellibrachia satsuma]